MVIYIYITLYISPRSCVLCSQEDGAHFNVHWGFLSRAGLNDKSQLAIQIEKYADIYTSRVSNFLRYTPFMYFRSPSQSLAHDRNLTAYQRMRQRRSLERKAAEREREEREEAEQQRKTGRAAVVGGVARSSLSSVDDESALEGDGVRGGDEGGAAVPGERRVRETKVLE